MSVFVNTVDVVGDEALTTSFIERSITEIADNFVTQLLGATFEDCKSLTKADFPALTFIANYVFSGCTKLKALVLRNTDAICTTEGSSAIARSGIANGTGYIYVPRALVEEYKAATNWSVYSTQFRALEDYTVDGTTTGELDETKI